MTSYGLELLWEQSDFTSSIFNDASDYDGEVRTDKANFLVVAKMDKNGTPTYLAVANPAPLTATDWTFPTTKEGWYRANLLRMPLYSASPVNTVANVTILYHTPTSQVVKAKTTGTITVQPGETGWATYWTVVSDLTTIVGSAVDVLTWSDLVDCRLRAKLRDRTDELNQVPYSNVPHEWFKRYDKVLRLEADLDSLQVMNSADEYAEMEEATRVFVEMYNVLES
jgi:hypothetical protein